jgi:hypothetical protein
MVGRPQSYEVLPDMKTREAIALAKGIYMNKNHIFCSLFYKMR